MLSINKETLKDLLCEEIKALILYYEEEALNKEGFKLEFSADRSEIIFEAITESIYGNDCWDSQEKKQTNSLAYVDYYQIKSIFDKLIIDYVDLEKYNITSDIDINEYFRTDSLDFYFFNEIEKTNEDHYYNHDILRTINIPIDSIAQELINFKYTKPLEDLLESFEYLGRHAKDKYLEIEAKNNSINNISNSEDNNDATLDKKEISSVNKKKMS